MNDHSPAKTMFRSGVVVAGGTLLILISKFAALALAAKLFYPSTFELLTQPNFWEKQVEFPAGLFWLSAVFVFVVAAFVGGLTVRMVPFSPGPHLGFLAVILFVSQLQNLITQPPGFKWMAFVMMIILPVAVICGGRIAWPNSAVQDGLTESEPEVSGDNEAADW